VGCQELSCTYQSSPRGNAPFLIIIRVANRRALTSDTIVSGDIGSIGGSETLPEESPTSSVNANGETFGGLGAGDGIGEVSSRVLGLPAVSFSSETRRLRESLAFLPFIPNVASCLVCTACVSQDTLIAAHCRDVTHPDFREHSFRWRAFISNFQ